MGTPTRLWELLVSLLVLALGSLALLLGSRFPRTEEGYLGPGLFPTLLGTVLILASLGLILSNLRKPGLLQSLEPDLLTRLLPVLALLSGLLLAPWLVPRLGLLLTTALFSMLTALLLGARWAEALFLGGFMMGFVYLVFVLLLGVQA